MESSLASDKSVPLFNITAAKKLKCSGDAIGEAKTETVIQTHICLLGKLYPAAQYSLHKAEGTIIRDTGFVKLA